VPLPRNPNVVNILQAYSTAEKGARPKRPGSAEADIFEEVISGIQVYFDRCLGNILLYRFERQQYVDIRRSNDGKEMSEIYGAEHLLRLFGISNEMRLELMFSCSFITRLDRSYEHGSTKYPDIEGPH
jgi:mortality factor 4-like protein 1